MAFNDGPREIRDLETCPSVLPHVRRDKVITISDQVFLLEQCGFEGDHPFSVILLEYCEGLLPNSPRLVAERPGGCRFGQAQTNPIQFRRHLRWGSHVIPPVAGKAGFT
jgi:hypothetical protein